MRQGGKIRRGITTLAGTLALVAGVALVGDASANPSESPESSKIAGVLLKTFDTREKSDFWVRLAENADTSAAARVADRAERGRRVMDTLRSTAEKSQAPVRSILGDHGLRSEAFWATNAIYVRDATVDVARELAALPGVEEIRAPKVYPLTLPVSTTPSDATPDGLEWGLSNINADDVWAKYGNHGEDIVVASIDSGVQYDHPALVNSYRGNNGDGTFTHDYNWIETTDVCDTAEPCDDHGHGTHTMGTITGDDGAGNQIGVAPGARWITANACAGGSCMDADLIAASQWMLAPTDLAGQNPDPAKRPHIVNNSWGTDPSDAPFMEDIQQAWADAGIMGIWANGNAGPSCKTSGAPGSRTLNYSVGAYDVNNSIGSFSSRGPGQEGETKPNISAPGVGVRSAVPGNGYALMSGTSMAAPHAAGAVALLWSAIPGYARDIAGTRSLLDVSAIDTADPQCGGVPGDNNVYGEGRLDALALTDIASTGLGTLTGAVTDATTGLPIAGARVSVTGPTNANVSTGGDGRYRLTLRAGEYQVSVSAYSYVDTGTTVQVTRDGEVTGDLAMPQAPRTAVTGTVTDGSGQGWPLSATITATDAAGHAFRAETDPETGRYELGLVPETYTVKVVASVVGYESRSEQIVVADAPLNVDVALPVTVNCVAPGYEPERKGPLETFDRSRAPRGWTVANTDRHYPGYGFQPGWVFDNPGGRANSTGGDGGFVIVDSRHSGLRNVQDTNLTSKVYDLRNHPDPVVEFGTDLVPAVNSTARVEISLDGGRTWTEIWRNKGFPGAVGPSTQVVEIPQAAGKARVIARFHFLGQNSGWWAIDNVYLGDRPCTATR